VQEYHIDGFRFDLASIMTRAPSAWHPAEWIDTRSRHGPGGRFGGGAPGHHDHMHGGPQATGLHSRGAVVADEGYMTDGSGTPTGAPLADPPVVQMIAEDPVLRSTKLIAEAWDCDGLNQARCPRCNMR
jgi:isoamylase